MKRTLLTPLLLAVAGAAHSQIYYQDIVPDKVISTWNVRTIVIDTLATASISANDPKGLDIWNDFGNSIVVDAPSPNPPQVLMNGAFPAALSASAAIGSSSTWIFPYYEALNDGSNGYWKGVTDKYLGVRIKRAGQWHYGWIRMDINAAGTSVTIKDYACNLKAGEAINAGQTTISTNTVVNTTGIAETTEELALECYPNPSPGRFTIVLPDPAQSYDCQIFNVEGRQVFCATITSGKEVNAESLAPGQYYVYLSAEGCTVKRQTLIIRK